MNDAVTRNVSVPAFPVDGYQLQRYYANGAKVKPLPAKAFSPVEVQAIIAWFTSIGWSVTSGSGANGVNATNDVGMTVDDLPEPYTAAQRKKDEARKAADERAAAKQKAQDDYLASTDAGKFVSAMFGESMNSFNLMALAKVLAGDEKTFGGLFSNRALDVLTEAGIATEWRQVKDVVADIKAKFAATRQGVQQAADNRVPEQNAEGNAAMMLPDVKQNLAQQRLAELAAEVEDRFLTANDVLPRLREIIDDAESGDVPQELIDAVERFEREGAEEYAVWGGRGGSFAAGDALLKVLSRFDSADTMTVDGSVPAPASAPKAKPRGPSL
jgi:hypothetical protein